MPEEAHISVLQIPVRLYKARIREQIDGLLPDTLYEDADMDGWRILAEKAGSLELDMQPSAVLFRVPLSVLIRKSTFLGNVEATAEVAMDFQTNFSINKEWDLETSTQLINHEWTRRPFIRWGGASLPVQRIADGVISRSRDRITFAIDEEIRRRFSLRELVRDAWAKIQQPVLVSDEFDAWLSIQPRRLGISEFRIDHDTFETHLYVESDPQVFLGRPPSTNGRKKLPEFQYQDFGTGEFWVSVNSLLTYSDMERIAKENLVGQTFSQGKRVVEVRDIRLFGRGNRLVVETELAGNYKGKVFLTGEPVVEPETEKVVLQDLDFELQTKNILHKSAGWLFKGTLKNRIQESLQVYLGQNLREIRESVSEQLNIFDISPGIRLFGDLRDIGIARTFITQDGLEVQASLEGKVLVEISGFR